MKEMSIYSIPFIEPCAVERQLLAMGLLAHNLQKMGKSINTPISKQAYQKAFDAIGLMNTETLKKARQFVSSHVKPVANMLDELFGSGTVVSLEFVVSDAALELSSTILRHSELLGTNSGNIDEYTQQEAVKAAFLSYHFSSPVMAQQLRDRIEAKTNAIVDQHTDLVSFGNTARWKVLTQDHVTVDPDLLNDLQDALAQIIIESDARMIRAVGEILNEQHSIFFYTFLKNLNNKMILDSDFDDFSQDQWNQWREKLWIDFFTSLTVDECMAKRAVFSIMLIEKKKVERQLAQWMARQRNSRRIR